MTYRDVTPLLAIDASFPDTMTVDEAVTQIQSDMVAIVADDDTAVEVLVRLGADPTHAKRQVIPLWGNPTAGLTDP